MYFFLIFFKDKWLYTLLLIFFSLNPVFFMKWFSVIDQISFFLVLLTIIVILMTNSILNFSKSFKMIFFMNMIFVSMILFFLSFNLFSFYLMFEFSLIPILMIILGWGYQIERIQAAIFLLTYMVIFSFPFLMSMVIGFKSWNLFLVYFFLKGSVFLNLMLIVFFVKSPLFFFHYWLPKAHVEASVGGSMVLAGALLKMGGYGIYRFFIALQIFQSKWIYIFFYVCVMFSMIFCLTQSDLKAMIAFSSVNHMSFMILSVYFFSKMSLLGALLLMVIHGFISSLMFFSMNYFYYQSFSRMFYYSHQFLFFLKLSSVMVFLLLVMNLNFPPLFSFFSEIFMLMGLIYVSKLNFVLILILSLLLCYFCVFMMMNMIFSKFKLSMMVLNSEVVMSLNMFTFIFFSLVMLLNFSFF